MKKGEIINEGEYIIQEIRQPEIGKIMILNITKIIKPRFGKEKHIIIARVKEIF